MKRLAMVTLSLLTLRPALTSAALDDEDDDEDAAEPAKRDGDRTQRRARDDEDDEEESSNDDQDDDRPAKGKRAPKGKRARGEDDDAEDAEAPRGGGAGPRTAYHYAPPRLTFAGELLGATPLDGGNRDLFGMGGGVGLGAELYATPLIGVSAGVALLGLRAGDGMSSTTFVAGQLGPRLHLAPVLFGLDTRKAAWIDAHVIYGSSGGIRRPGFDVGAALQWEVKPALRIGPMIRYQFGQDPRDVHAQLFTIGLAVGFGGRERVAVHVEGDEDGDGILDDADQCPGKPAGESPDPKRAGCPVPDADGDGVLDRDDECPDDEVGDSPDPQHPGCPLKDADGDKIPDKDDRCPKDAGPPNPFTPAQHGCPALARVVENKIEILQQIFFETDSATIKDESFPVLQAVATTVKGLSGARVRVEGHTDQQGTDEYNLDLSKRRARAVAQWLVQNGGIDSKLLETEGYGRSRPIVSGSKADIAQNRRVEFVILGR